MRQLLKEPGHVFACIPQRRGTGGDDKSAFRQLKVLPAYVLVLRFKNCRVDSRKNYLYAAAGFGYWTSPRDISQPMAVCDHACSTTRINAQFARVRGARQKPICRPSQ